MDDITNAASANPSLTSGVSNPPDSGEVTSTASAFDTPGQAGPVSTPAASPSPSPSPSAAQGPAAIAPTSKPGSPAPAAPQSRNWNELDAQGVARPPKKQPWNELNAVNGIPSDDVVKHPSVQKAGLLHTIAETLAGGPRYSESIDVNTGEMKRVPVPLSRGDIGMAIAMEAISGALAGLTLRGPGAEGRAAAAGFQQVKQQQQEVQQKQDQVANEDYARHMQVLETNMRMHQSAMTLSRMDFDAHKAHVDEYKDIAEKLQNDYPDMIQDRVSERDLSKYHVTKDMAIPVGVSPVLDPKTGKQANDQYGSPMWEEQYLVLKPDFKALGFLSPEDVATLAEMGKTGFAKGDGSGPIEWPQNQAIAARLQLGLKAEAVAYRLAKQNRSNYYSALNEGATGGGNVPTQTPEMTRTDFQDIADQAATHNSVSTALVRAVIMEESHEDPKALNRKSGAMGLMQLMPDTAKEMGVVHAFDPTENINGGTKNLAKCLNQYKGNVRFALAAYNGAAHPTDPATYKPETKKYIADISKAVGLGAAQQSGDTIKPVDLADAVKNDPTLVRALEQFNSLLNATGGNYEKAIGEIKDPTVAGKLTELFGGNEAMHQYDTQREAVADTIKRQRDNALDEEKKRQEAADKLAIDQRASADLKQMLKGPEGFTYTPDMQNMEDGALKDKLASMGVQIPDNWDSLYAIATYHDSPNGYAPRVWTKGSPGEMDKQSALEYIHKYINPGYKEYKYNSIAQNQKRFSDPDSKEGQTQMNAGTASQHLEMARQAAHLLSNEPGASSIPFINNLAGEIGAAVGKTPFLTLQAILDKANDEVTKVAMGGGMAYLPQIEAGRKNMNAGNAEQQIDSIIEAYTKMMYGRLMSLDAASFKVGREHLPMMADETNALFERYNLPVPWKDNDNAGGEIHPRQTQSNGQGGIPQGVRPPQGNEQPVYHNGQFLGYSVDGKKFSYKYQGPGQNPGRGWL